MTLSTVRRLSRSCGPLAAAAALLAAGAVAGQPMLPGQPTLYDVHQACLADIHKYCPEAEAADARTGGATPRGGQTAACIRAHFSALSDGCKSAIAKRRAEHRSPPPPGYANPDR